MITTLRYPTAVRTLRFESKPTKSDLAVQLTEQGILNGNTFLYCIGYGVFTDNTLTYQVAVYDRFVDKNEPIYDDEPQGKHHRARWIFE